MTSRQRPWPIQWLVADAVSGKDLSRALMRLPRGSGIIVLSDPGPHEKRKLRRSAHLRSLTLVYERNGTAARVHDTRELRQACLKRVPLILLSPVYATRSHPDWRPLPRMRAAALARLGGRQVIALGGMDERRFRIVQQLGFVGWAGISAWSALPKFRLY